MSKIVVDLQEKQEVPNSLNVLQFGDYQKGEERGTFRKILKVFSIILVSLIIISFIGGFFYWRYLKTTPQYSLALIINAARRDDQKTIDELVNLDAIVEDFLPQVVDKAVELYGRGVAPDVIEKARLIAAPLLPVVKQRAKAELPDLILEKTRRFENIPFWAIAIGAKRYLDIEKDGDKAIIKSKLKDRPLEIEMKKNGTKWQIVAINDEQTAQKIARKIGQEVLTMAKSKDAGTIENVGKKIGLDNANDLLRQVEGIFK
ncbi:MAG: hypothetical protein M3405_08605 [Acidobacteriota bacterium]|jgi:general stress protein YciG|nr:hypothetical protein [Acidobacteriota bacterium]